MDSQVYQLFDGATPVMVVWLGVFVALTLVQILLAAVRGTGSERNRVVSSEVSGFPLIAMHTVCFVYAVWLGDWLSAILFGWWGPGFVYFAYVVVSSKLRKVSVDWSRHGRWTSIACKLYYVVLVAVLYYHDAYGPIFCYSLWIMNDQVALAWLQQNADRTRRVSEDVWVLRIAYPVLLALPLLDQDFPLRAFASVLAIVTAGAWIAGLYRVVMKFEFARRPSSYTDNLRDIVYLKEQDPR